MFHSPNRERGVTSSGPLGTKMSRREFLTLVLTSTGAAALTACRFDKTGQQVVVPTSSTTGPGSKPFGPDLPPNDVEREIVFYKIGGITITNRVPQNEMRDYLIGPAENGSPHSAQVVLKTLQLLKELGLGLEELDKIFEQNAEIYVVNGDLGPYLGLTDNNKMMEKIIRSIQDGRSPLGVSVTRRIILGDENSINKFALSRYFTEEEKRKLEEKKFPGGNLDQVMLETATTNEAFHLVAGIRDQGVGDFLENRLKEASLSMELPNGKGVKIKVVSIGFTIAIVATGVPTSEGEQTLVDYC